MPVVNNVVAGSMATLDLLMGVRYHALHLVYGGATFTPALMDNIRVLANNNVIHNLTGIRRDTLNQFDGFKAASTNKVLTIPFYRAGMKDTMQKYYTCLNTLVPCPQAPNGITALQLQIDVDAGASAPTLQVYAEISDTDASQGQALLRSETWYENVANTGDYLHQHKYNGDKSRPLVSRFGFWDTDTNISGFYMVENTVQMINRTSKLNEQIQTEDSFKAVQSGAVIFDTAEQGNFGSTLKLGGIGQFELHTIHTATNTNLPVTVESLGSLAA
jgi:hypothetical protein